MAQEFIDILNEIKKKPAEEKLNQMIETFENIIKLFFKLPEIIDEKMNLIEQRIISLEESVISPKKTPKDFIALPPPLSPSSSIIIKNKGPENVRGTIINELKILFKKKNTDKKDNLL